MPRVSLVSVARFMVRQRRAAVLQSASRISGSSRCGSTDVYQEPGPEDDPVGQFDGGERLDAGGRVLGQQPDAVPASRRRRISPARVSVCSAEVPSGAVTRTWPSMVSGTLDIGRTSPRAPSSAPAHLRPGDGVAQELPERHDQQVAHGVFIEGTAAALAGGEAVLHDVAPGAAPVRVVAQRGERHPEVAGRQDAVLLAQPSGGSAVVGDRDDGGQLGGEQAQRRQRGGEAMAAAERDDGGAFVLLAGEGRAGRRDERQRAGEQRHYSRPRSRWVVVTVTRGYCASRRDSSTATATERCLPPVQPTAMVA